MYKHGIDRMVITRRVSRAGRFFAALMLGSTIGVSTQAQDYSIHRVAPDTSLWNLYGDATTGEFQGRTAIRLNSAASELRNVEIGDGILDAEVFTEAKRAFFGFQFRIRGGDFEEVYLRKHKSGLPDAMQYTPVLRTGRNWQIFSGQGFTGAVDIPSGEWFHLRLEVTGAQAKLFVSDTVRPALLMDDLKSGLRTGGIALYSLGGPVLFSNFQWQATREAPWIRHFPPMSKNAIVHWSLSSSYDALARDLERPLSAGEIDTMRWQDVQAEPPGIVVVQRYRDAPHPNVTFQNDFSTRLKPQPGISVVYARTQIESEKETIKKLSIGYSDEVSVFLNGRILFRGRSAQSFRDPGFLGIVDPEDDAVYLPLKKGNNELILAVSELGGGWGFICRCGEEK